LLNANGTTSQVNARKHKFAFEVTNIVSIKYNFFFVEFCEETVVDYKRAVGSPIWQLGIIFLFVT
jgi:hypothetical protein